MIQPFINGEGKSNGKNEGHDVYNDMQVFCKSATLEEVKALNYALTSGMYVGLGEEVDDFNFAERFTVLKTEAEKQIAEEDALNERIMINLSRIMISTEGKSKAR